MDNKPDTESENSNPDFILKNTINLETVLREEDEEFSEVAKVIDWVIVK